MAWPRLAEYFARFQLSTGLNCRLEVLAPSLSRVPLHVRPEGPSSRNNRPQPQSQLRATSEDDSTPNKQQVEWKDILAEQESEEEKKEARVVTPEEAVVRRGNVGTDPETHHLLCAAQKFLERPVHASNMAHAVAPIRLEGGKLADAPKLEATLIVHGNQEGESSHNQDDGLEHPQNHATNSSSKDEAVATMALIRMVNQIPLLDSAEGVACGLVQGVVSKDSLWQAAGLDVSLRPSSSSSITRVPTYTVKDSAQVLPFLKSQHATLEDEDDDASSSDGDSDESIGGAILEGTKSRRRRKPRPRNVFLPADARLGNVLLIVHIQAQPSQLPLPTLCKGRIPQDNHPINTALAVSLKTCLRKLQTSNPALFLTSRELRIVERKVCFVPNVSRAVATILCKSNSEAASDAMDTIQEWKEEDAEGDHDESDRANYRGSDGIGGLALIIQRRLQKNLNFPKTKPSRRGDCNSDNSEEGEESVGSSQDDQDLLKESPLIRRPAKQLRWESDSTDGKEDDSDSSNDDGGAYEDLM